MYVDRVIQTALHELSPGTLYTSQDVERIIKNAFLNLNDEILFTRKEAAKYLRLAPSTLASWDCRKTHDLQPIRVGKRLVMYKKPVLDKFLADRQIKRKHRPIFANS